MVCGTPFALHKLVGRIQFEWIGYWLDVARFEVGITVLRAAWATGWLADKVRERRVRLGELREALGRLQFIAGPLELLRPFLGPLYAWSCAGPPHAQPVLPTMLLLIMRHLEGQLRASCVAHCREKAKDLGEMFRLDAKAEGDAVAIGGWRTTGGARTRDAPWFALELTSRTAPWAFT